MGRRGGVMADAMVWRPFSRTRPGDIRLLERICRESGSESVRRHAAFLRTAVWQTKDRPDRLWCEILNDAAFYMCVRCRGHVRGVDTVVMERYHGRGWGRALHARRVARMVAAGIPLFRFRTNRDNSALGFWLKQGARIVDVNGDDYEMELRVPIPAPRDNAANAGEAEK